jgi:hypothetical protein
MDEGREPVQNTGPMSAMSTSPSRPVQITGLARPGRSIRTRLALLLILFTVLPGLFIGFLVGLVGLNSTQTSLLDTLNAVAGSKEAQVKNWAEYLDLNLAAEVDRDGRHAA